MQNRISKTGASFYVAHGATITAPASVAQASSLHTALPLFKAHVAQPSWLHSVHALRPDSALTFKRFVWADGVRPSSTFATFFPACRLEACATPFGRGTLEISGANLMYEGARVKSWMLGRDVNPAGRGDGAYYAQGAFSIGSVRPSPTTTHIGGWGNSVNNWCGGGCGITPPVGPDWSGDLPTMPPIFPGGFPQRPEKVSPKLPLDSKPRPMPDPVPPPSPPGGKDPDGKYKDCEIFLHTCKICEEPCTWEQWNDPLMHEECCERLRRIAKCDPCVSQTSLFQLLECYECKKDLGADCCCVQQLPTRVTKFTGGLTKQSGKEVIVYCEWLCWYYRYVNSENLPCTKDAAIMCEVVGGTFLLPGGTFEHEYHFEILKNDGSKKCRDMLEKKERSCTNKSSTYTCHGK